MKLKKIFTSNIHNRCYIHYKNHSKNSKVVFPNLPHFSELAFVTLSRMTQAIIILVIDCCKSGVIGKKILEGGISSKKLLLITSASSSDSFAVDKRDIGEKTYHYIDTRFYRFLTRIYRLNFEIPLLKLDEIFRDLHFTYDQPNVFVGVDLEGSKLTDLVHLSKFDSDGVTWANILTDESFLPTYASDRKYNNLLTADPQPSKFQTGHAGRSADHQDGSEDFDDVCYFPNENFIFEDYQYEYHGQPDTVEQGKYNKLYAFFDALADSLHAEGFVKTVSPFNWSLAYDNCTDFRDLVDRIENRFNVSPWLFDDILKVGYFVGQFSLEAVNKAFNDMI